MSLKISRNRFYILILVFGTLVAQFSAVRWDMTSDEESDERYRLLKRLFFDKSPASSTRAPSVLENLVQPPSTPKSMISTPKGSSSPSYPSSGSCAENPCENGGICIPKGQTTFECRCVGPWRGIYCGIHDACHRSPCQNGGICLNVHDDYYCQCSNAHYGINCELTYSNPSSLNNLCQPNICNTGRCVPLQTTYYCVCPNDRSGEHCEKRFSKRKASGFQMYYDFIHELKRGMKNNPHNHHNPNHGEDVALYDVKNGIYF